jgi:hypothetical protein
MVFCAPVQETKEETWSVFSPIHAQRLLLVHTGTVRAEAMVRETQAVELRMRGASYDAIAQRLGYRNRSGAWKAVQRALDKKLGVAVETYFENELDRLTHIELASFNPAAEGNLRAAGYFLTALEQRRKLLAPRPGDIRYIAPKAPAATFRVQTAADYVNALRAQAH